MPLSGTMVTEQGQIFCLRERSKPMELKIEHISKQFKDKTAVDDVKGRKDALEIIATAIENYKIHFNK